MSFQSSPDTETTKSSEYKHTGTPSCPLCRKIKATAARSRNSDDIHDIPKCYEENRPGEYTRTF